MFKLDVSHTAVGNVVAKISDIASGVDTPTPPNARGPTSSFSSCSPCKYTMLGLYDSRVLHNSSLLGLFRVWTCSQRGINIAIVKEANNDLLGTRKYKLCNTLKFDIHYRKFTTKNRLLHLQTSRGHQFWKGISRLIFQNILLGFIFKIFVTGDSKKTTSVFWSPLWMKHHLTIPRE